MSLIGKKFLLEHYFQEINSMEEQEMVMGPVEEHLGIPWQLSLKRDEGNLNVVLNCNSPNDDGTWSITSEVKGQLVSTKGGVVTKIFSTTHTSTGDANTDHSFLSWESLERDYLVDGSIQIYVEVKIKTATGFPKKKLIHFDESPEPNVTQGVLTVEGEQFYVDKAFLAFQSTEFNALFFGKKGNLKKKEFQLDGIRSSDFQSFLEDVHHAKAIDDGTVDGILGLAKQFQVEDSIKRCEKFLVKKSEKSFKDKLKIATDYDLQILRDHCLIKLDTKEKILSVVPGVSTDMDPTVACFLLKKVCSLKIRAFGVSIQPRKFDSKAKKHRPSATSSTLTKLLEKRKRIGLWHLHRHSRNFFKDEMNRKQQEADRKLLKLLHDKGDKVVLGEACKFDEVKQIMVKSEESDEYCTSGRVLCTLCNTVLSANEGGHVQRHRDRCSRKRAGSEPLPEKCDESFKAEEPFAKQRKLTDFAKRQFTKEQTSKITKALAKHALTTGKSFNYMGGSAMKNLVIDIANVIGSGLFGMEAKAQIPHRQTIQKQTLQFSDELVDRAFTELKQYVGKGRVQLLVDHGKIVSNYLSMFASYIDDSFELKLLPIGFIPCPDGKTGADTADAIIDRLQTFGWSEEEAKSCSITADGALANLGTYFASYIRCVSHSIHLLAEKVVDPLEKHAKKMDPEVTKLLHIAMQCLDHAQTVSSALRNNYQACSEVSRLPTLPNDTRWLNGLKCLVDVTELSKEILDIVPKLSLKGRTSMYWISDNSTYVNAVLHVLKPLLTYSIDFQKQNEITIHRVLPAYNVLLTKWSAYKDRDFTKIKDKDIMDLDLVEAMATSGHIAVTHYYKQFGNHHYGATLLSPRTKHMKNFTKEEKEKAMSFITDILPKDPIVATTDTSEVPEYIMEMSDNTEKPPTHSELKRYLDETFNVKSCEKVEEYWRRKRLDYPGLYTVATKVLSIVPSESVCETTFSTAAFLLDKRRTRLGTETVEKIVIGSQIASRNPDWVDDLKMI